MEFLVVVENNFPNVVFNQTAHHNQRLTHQIHENAHQNRQNQDDDAKKHQTFSENIV